MKKQRYLRTCLIMMLCLLALFMPGCGNENKEGNISGEEKVNDEKTTDPDEEETDENSQEQTGKEGLDADNAAEENQIRTVTVYYVDGQTAEVTAGTAEIQNEQDIWNALIENGILTEECKLLSFKVDEAEGKIDLDFNAATGGRIRSMGTAGETQILGCIVNTYLEAYNCDGIRLTEEGQAFESSHGADFSGYSGIMTF